MGVTFAQAASDYVGHHLPSINCSQNTVRSYCNGLVSFIEFCQGELGKDAGAFAPDDFTYELGCGYVEHLKSAGLAPSSINQRMACLRSFTSYLAKRNLAYLQASTAIAGVRRQREEKPLITWMTVEEVRCLLSVPDPFRPSGLRDLALLALLYDSAARAQEVCDLDVADVNVRAKTATLTGKGRKTRSVPISRQTANIVRRHVAGSGYGEGPLVRNGSGGRLTPSGVQWIISKNVAKAREAGGGMLLDKKITAHIFRHSKAMHMLEAGVELVYIRDFLGHKSVTTTEVYARASPEAKRKAIEEHVKSLSLAPGRISAEKEASVIEKIRKIARACE